MALTTNLQNSYALTANSNDAVGSVNGTDTSVSYTTTGGNLSATYNGTSSKTVMSGPTLTGSGDITIVGWIRILATGADSAGYFVSNRKASDDNVGIYNFRVDSSGKLNFWDYDGGAFGFPTASLSTTALSANTWYHVAFTKIGTAGTYYLNGSSDGTTTASANKSYSSSGTHPMTLGIEAASIYYFGGSMTGFQFYTRALSGAEITQLYNGGTVLQYPFATAYTLAIAVGAFVYSGKATGLLFNRLVSIAKGTFTYTGFDTALNRGRGIIIEFGSYILEGIAVALRYNGWTNQNKNNSTWTDQSKNDSTWTNQNKN